jgi:hypothetical protein
MTDARKFFVLSTPLSFGLGIASFVYFYYLEYEARQKLSPEMKTPEAIQKYYDGSVCLGCDIAGIGLMLLFFALGILTTVLWGIYEIFSKKQTLLK